jgi:hypothetical protein
MKNIEEFFNSIKIMLFPYNFGEKLDLTKFRKQGSYHIGKLAELSYDLYLPFYKIKINIQTEINTHNVDIVLYDIKRDEDGEVIETKMILPLKDVRFKEDKNIQTLFAISINDSVGYFSSNSVGDTINKICQFIKYCHKINGMKAFL